MSSAGVKRGADQVGAPAARSTSSGGRDGALGKNQAVAGSKRARPAAKRKGRKKVGMLPPSAGTPSRGDKIQLTHRPVSEWAR